MPTYMTFTVLFSDDEDTKKKIMDNIFGGEHVVFTKNYSAIKRNYERALEHLNNGITYDYFKLRKPLQKFKHFRIIQETLTKQEKPHRIVNDNVIILFDSSVTHKENRIVTGRSSVRDIKRIVYDKIGLSVSKQEICRNTAVLGNAEIICGETVIVRQKRRSNK